MGQLVHDDAVPVSSLYVPGGQTLHGTSVVRPNSSEYVPAGHLPVQSAAVAALEPVYKPDGQPRQALLLDGYEPPGQLWALGNVHAF